MMTAVDTCVLMDIMEGTGPHVLGSSRALAAASEGGLLLISEVVYAELAAFTGNQTQLEGILAKLGVDVVPLGRDAAFQAGMMFAAYRRAGGKRERILTDFLIAAHAHAHADRLLTRDRGFYREHFADLRLMDAAAGADA